MESISRAAGFRAKIVLLIAAQLLLLVGIGSLVSYQIRLVDEKITDMADLKDPSPFTANLVGDLSQINLQLVGYLQNRDTQGVQHITDGEKNFETAVVDFQKLNPRLFPSAAQTRILNAYQPFKDAVADTLRTADSQASKWEELLTNNDRIVFLLEQRLRPLVRDRQQYSGERTDLILNLESQVRAIPRNLTQYLFQHSSSPEQTIVINDRKFENFLKIYQRIAPLAVERNNLITLDGLWSDNMTLAQDITQLEKSKVESFSRMAQGNQTLQGTISAVLPAVRPEVIEEKKDAILHSITWIAIIAGIMLLLGVGSTILCGLWVYRTVRRSFEDIQQVAEAAAQGDFTKELGGESARQLGSMASAVNQLIGSMRRSEEMIVQLGSMVESSGDAAIGLNLDGIILSWNRNAERIYGYSSQQVKGQAVDMLFASERAQEVGLIHEKLREGKKLTFDTLHVRKNGSIFRAHLIVHKIVDTTGQTIGISVLSREMPHVSDAPPNTKSNNMAA